MVGPQVVLTGAVGSLHELVPLLLEQGMRVEQVALLGFEPPASWATVDRALQSLQRYAAIAITSPRAAHAVLARVKALGLNADSAPVVWTGVASAAVLGDVFPLVRIPEQAQAGPASLAVAMAGGMLQAGVGSPILFPCGAIHREELPVRLRAAGRRVEPVICYHTRVASPDEARAALRGADIVVATSPVLAQVLATVRPPRHTPMLVAIGATTAEAAAASGWTPDAIAERPTAPAVARAIQSLSVSPS